MKTVIVLTLASLAFSIPTSSPRSTALKPYQLRGVSDPIFHLYLQALPASKSTPVMGPVATSEYFNIGDTIQSTNTSMFLNIGNSTVSYKPLSFDAAANGSPWALEGDTIITSTGSSYGRQLNFLVCADSVSGYYDVYLQTGSDVPAGKSCSNYQTLHLPCLC